MAGTILNSLTLELQDIPELTGEFRFESTLGDGSYGAVAKMTYIETGAVVNSTSYVYHGPIC